MELARGAERRFPLLAHDLRILRNEIAAAIPRWRDAALAAAMLALFGAGLHAWFAGQSPAVAAWLLAGGGALAGTGIGSLVRRRIEFHASDGILAAEALRPQPAYRLTCHAIAFAALMPVLLAARAELAGYGVAGCAAGALAMEVGGRLQPARDTRRRFPRARAVRAWLRLPEAGATLAAAVAAAAFAICSLAPDAVAPIAGALLIGATLALTSLDDAAIRYAALSGERVMPMLVRHARALLPFAAFAVPAAALLIGAEAAAVVAITVLAALALMVLRLFAYRLYRLRAADTLVMLALGAIGLAAVAAPPLAPVVLAVTIWQLARRAARRTWLVE